MKRVLLLQRARRTVCFIFSLLLVFSPAVQVKMAAQTAAPQTGDAPDASKARQSVFRIENKRVAGGAELLTVFGSLDGLNRGDATPSQVPLVSILRDTLGDADPENDRLRYVWMLSYTRPSFLQRAAATVPFLYNRVGNKKRVGKGDPPPIIDLSSASREVWNSFFLTALQNILLDSYGIPIKAATRTYRRNVDEYRKAHVVRALAILSLYESATPSAPVFSEAEMRDIQARLMLTEKALGGIIDDVYLQRVYQKQTTSARDVRGHNWELLRQRAEAESLYFEPLELPDGSATHALLWVARPDLVGNRDKRFDSRFLNIANPWRDDRLRDWKNFTATRYFDANNRPVDPSEPGSRAIEMIPLALYGLDHPKIPILLVDFRDRLNPKKREMSRRVLKDVTTNLLSLSRFGDVPYFLGRTVYDFVTGRRGADLNQPSRLRTYSQLKLMLALNASLDPNLRDEISNRLERVSLNPLENDLEAEARLARDQYAALIAYADRPDGLPARLARDRRAEMMPLVHGRAEQALLRLANVLSFGLYIHHEKATPELLARMEVARRLDYHERFLRQVSRSGPQIEVVWNIEEVRRSLRFIAENGKAAGGKVAAAAASIFARTDDEETRLLCLNCLYRIDNETAKNALLRINRDLRLDAKWRELTTEYLRKAVREEQRIAPSDAKAILSLVGQ